MRARTRVCLKERERELEIEGATHNSTTVIDTTTSSFLNLIKIDKKTDAGIQVVSCDHQTNQNDFTLKLPRHGTEFGRRLSVSKEVFRQIYLFVC